MCVLCVVVAVCVPGRVLVLVTLDVRGETDLRVNLKSVKVCLVGGESDV